MTKALLVDLFSVLGKELERISEKELVSWKEEALVFNKWFTPENIDNALKGIVFMLDRARLEQWLSIYTLPVSTSRKIGVVMAGNIPMVGFHDMLTVLLSGHTLMAKLSSEDPILVKKIAEILVSLEPKMKNRIQFVDKLTGIDALIATGSDNTAKHFDYYFASIPRLIRRNRVSVAVLTGNETSEEMVLLGSDMLLYFGLGCRNVAKLYIPNDMLIDRVYEALEDWKILANHNKYGNNYDYNRSIYLLKSVVHFDNGFLVAVESEELVSPIAVFYFERYNALDSLKLTLKEHNDKLQCIVSSAGVIEGAVPFGGAQCPAPWEYADGVDTLVFLTAL